MAKREIAPMIFSDVYPFLVKKAERKNRTKEEVDTIIFWLTGYDEQSFQNQLDRKVTYQTFFEEAPSFNSNAYKITGTICGIKVQDIENPIEQKARFLDKLIDELSKGKPMDKILRK